ncbi:MAG: symmetrical bis(5'-nucleosyl)-tetraphosphatase [Spongiibacteraceae bacterium]|jgi:bis(5'-nucleosyl)-tetraphosphatase (symmetrical)|nr:symmetrical bis(5'-nucleosyl)-tetraphosphatase [Spongiibacteraceae bacterium]
MARYAVGDLQGCLDPLLRLLERVAFDPTCDQLWSVGDLVNRGPQSLAALRYFYELGDAARVVLGNHDLHLLAVAEGIQPVKQGDTIDDILSAPDRDALLSWLRQQPLFYQDPRGDFAMAHAGIAPDWNFEQAQCLSDELQEVLRGPLCRHYLETMYGDEPDHWHESLQGPERWRVITNYFTRMRFCHADGALDLRVKTAPADAPAHLRPWFELLPSSVHAPRLLFGHWAALQGRSTNPRCIGLDTGCVWGNQLTLFNLETGERLTESCACA